MSDPFAHLNALRIRLSHEQDRLRNPRVRGKTLRRVLVEQIAREIVCETKFLAKRGIIEPEPAEMSDDAIQAALANYRLTLPS